MSGAEIVGSSLPSFPNVSTTTIHQYTIQTPLSRAFNEGAIDRDLTADLGGGGIVEVECRCQGTAVRDLLLIIEIRSWHYWIRLGGN